MLLVGNYYAKESLNVWAEISLYKMSIAVSGIAKGFNGATMVSLMTTPSQMLLPKLTKCLNFFSIVPAFIQGYCFEAHL